MRIALEAELNKDQFVEALDQLGFNINLKHKQPITVSIGRHSYTGLLGKLLGFGEPADECVVTLHRAHGGVVVIELEKVDAVSLGEME
jgi:hypothetical protein